MQCLWHALHESVTFHKNHPMLRVRLLADTPEKYWKRVQRVHEALCTVEMCTFLEVRKSIPRPCKVCKQEIEGKFNFMLIIT